MTQTQHQEQLTDIRKIQEFEKQVGLESSFQLWFDNKSKRRLMFVSTHIMEDVELVEGKKKLVEKFIVDVRYIGGRIRSFSREVWESSILMEGKLKVKRFVEINEPTL